MRRLILILFLLFAMPLVAQVSLSGVTIGSGVTMAGSVLGGSSAIGLLDGSFALSYNDPANVIEGMRFVYSNFQQAAAITNGTADSCSVVSGGLMYVIGGYGANASTPLNYVQIYDPVANSWSQGATIPTAEWGAGCAVYNGSIYVFGGVDSSAETPTDNAYVYSIAGDSWSTLTVLPSTVPDGLMAVTVGTKIYLLFESDFWEFDPSGAGGSGSYTALTTPPSAARVQWAATGYVNVSGDDRIYFIGGSTSAGSGYGNGNYYWSVTNSTWSGAQSTAPYSAHGELQGAVYNGSIYYTAGFDGSAFYTQLYAYTPATDSWSSLLGSTSQFHDGVCGGFISNTIYVCGGRNSIAPNVFGMTANEYFQIGSTPGTSTFTTIQLHYTGSPSGNVRLGIYADSAGSPGSLLIDAGAASMASGWTEITGLSVSSLTFGTQYWLAFIQNASASVSYSDGAPIGSYAGAHCSTTGTTYGALPSTFPTSGISCQVGSMYAEQLTR